MFGETRWCGGLESPISLIC